MVCSGCPTLLLMPTLR
ncbi:hypothetical protein EYQ95_06375 [Lysobacter sp. N42]|nr:hypothetical protein DQX04_06365 [Aliidiomarina sp. B3213]TCZ91771.1 hypothetical protein EYQ95_06375 [Lysobacter sp. N42]